MDELPPKRGSVRLYKGPKFLAHLLTPREPQRDDDGDEQS